MNTANTDEKEIALSKTDPDFIVQYAIQTKKARLCEQAELNVCNAYINICKKIKKNQKKKLNWLFQYLKFVKTIPNQKELLKNLSSECLSAYAVSTGKSLPKKYEKKLFSHVLNNDTELWDLTEYQHVIKTKLPEEVHNFILAKSMTENKIGPTQAYFLNLKKIKNTLVAISEQVGEDITLKDLIKMY